MAFQDHFSRTAAGYARYRPGYPAALFAFLAGVAPGRAHAWDAGTGSGQAARALAAHFARVTATDPSAEQIAHAEPHPRVTYRVEPAEACTLPDASVDLATVAQALHWFDANAYFAEVRRVVRPGGVAAVWAYNLMTVTPGVDAAVRTYYRDVLGPYWPPERAHFDRGYDVPFPFPRIETPPLRLEVAWDLDRMLGYLGTWSAAQRYRRATGADPVAAVRPALAGAWGPPERVRPVRWPLHVRVGRVG